MRRTSRARRWLTAGFATLFIPAGMAAAAAVNTPSALADQTNNYALSSSTNTSDPDIEPCFFQGQSGYCMYTSSDMNIGPQDGGQNTYPMSQTLGWWSPTGFPPWTAEGAPGLPAGVVFQESTYVTNGWSPAGADHLWAPAMAQGTDGNYYLYVPDIWNPANEDTSSFIGVEESTTGPFGPFTNVRDGGRGVITGGSTLNGGYASDPDVVTDIGGSRYLVFANGDFNNCGGISQQTMISNYQVVSATQLTINGISTALGTCGTTGHPYMEGPQEYRTSNWGAGVPGPYLLTFAAKPSNGVPAGCQTGYGQPGALNGGTDEGEVVAYATATNVAGPFTYGGILMCGSSTEWTDQASIQPVAVPGGYHALVMYYHDGPSGNPNRKVHATCLAFGNGKFAAGMRPVNVFNGLYANLGDCSSGSLANRWLFQAPNNTMITATTNPDQLAYTARIAAGEYESFSLFVGGTNTPPNGYLGTTQNISGSLVAGNASGFNTAVAEGSGAILTATSPLGTQIPMGLHYNSTTGAETVTVDNGADESDGTVRVGPTPTQFNLMHFYTQP